jgi:hypothetical protein
MRTLVVMVVVGLLSLGSSGCEDDGAGDGGAGAGGAGNGGSGAGSGGGRGGEGGGSGASGSGGAGAGGSSAGRGGSGAEPVPGTPCDMPCAAGQVCEYVQVQCVRAPCPPQPTCVDDAGGGGGACADQGESCTDDDACCDGLTCCIGVPVPPGEEFCGTVCPRSDRNAKRDFTQVASEAVLDGVERLPISTWRYDHEPKGTAHIGPMAQDFKATFQVGTDERYIATVDADGVALAAIQALSAKLDRLEAQQAKLRAENIALRTEIEALRARTQGLR